MSIFCFCFFVVLEPIDLILQTVTLAFGFLEFVQGVLVLGLDVPNFRHELRVLIPFPSELGFCFDCFLIVVFVLSFELMEFIFDSVAGFVNRFILSLVGLDFGFNVLDVFVLLSDFEGQ